MTRHIGLVAAAATIALLGAGCSDAASGDPAAHGEDPSPRADSSSPAPVSGGPKGSACQWLRAPRSTGSSPSTVTTSPCTALEPGTRR
jgi:hypothetical protein